MSAVSKKLIPASRAASTTFAVVAASMRQPKLLHPMPTTETLRDPMFRCSKMGSLLLGSEAVFHHKSEKTEMNLGPAR
jgi:hypothetical protein